ncbi:MAG: helix-turn-helix transcriptional regulator [Selenomonadaceae bacterium]|nr:helix-turn-helix transcriptional regulator [Selenomonadaceae bacterium]
MGDFMDFLTVFATRLRALRIEKGVMAKTLAEELHITPRTFLRYERGEVDPPSSKLLWLADYFGVSIDYLTGRTDNREINE